MHHPWWLESGAVHPGTEFPASGTDMDALVRECGVDLVLAAHEHNYQRLMRGEVAYVVVGTGGRSLYPVAGAPGGTAYSASAYGRLLIDVDASAYQAHFRTLADKTLDSFGGTANATPPATPSVTFTHGGGNEWWVEAKIDPKPVSAQAMDTGGAWKALEFKSWGEWAASFHVEPGHQVRFRATYSNGTTVESCWFSHPAGVAQNCGGTTATFDATFKNVRGNNWWVETDVTVTGGTHAGGSTWCDASASSAGTCGVDARVNGGSWIPLEKKSWGSWAKSVNAPAGSKVEFRARAADGSTDVSSTYGWLPS